MRNRACCGPTRSTDTSNHQTAGDTPHRGTQHTATINRETKHAGDKRQEPTQATTTQQGTPHTEEHSKPQQLNEKRRVLGINDKNRHKQQNQQQQQQGTPHTEEHNKPQQLKEKQGVRWINDKNRHKQQQQQQQETPHTEERSKPHSNNKSANSTNNNNDTNTNTNNKTTHIRHPPTCCNRSHA
jgi:hypothetical protein